MSKAWRKPDPELGADLTQAAIDRLILLGSALVSGMHACLMYSVAVKWGRIFDAVKGRN